jgi:undecaprenyl-diphosphatase
MFVILAGDFLNKFLKSITKTICHDKNNYFYITMLISFVFFLFLTSSILLDFSFINNFDNFIVVKFHNFAVKHSDNFMVFITNLGSANVILPISFFLIFGLMKFKRFREALFLFFITGGAGVMVIILKELICRSRPDVALVKVYWYGYPSGHTTLATCFYGALIYLILVHAKNKSIKLSFAIFFSILILLIGISRVYLGVHFPTDVLAGYSLGIFWTTLCVLVYKKPSNKN